MQVLGRQGHHAAVAQLPFTCKLREAAVAMRDTRKAVLALDGEKKLRGVSPVHSRSYRSTAGA
jgi:hypothetical protein